jgi:predicted ATPase
VLGRTVDRLKTLRVLLTITYRPEFEPPWVGRPFVTTLSLNRLGGREIAAMIDRVTGNKALPESVRQDIIERTDGVPLFVEEMTKAVLETESEEEAQRTAATMPSTALAVPASLHASLMARLDRLGGAAKEVAQIGAAIGREFSHALLGMVARKPGAEIQSALDRLMTAGLLFRQGVPPQASYLFKHALVRDAAYGTLLREPRRALHARVAETIQDQFGDIAESQPALLARHCTDAGLIEKAVSLWERAGQRSLARSALMEATEQFTHALALISTLPGTPALRRTHIKLQVAIITPLIHVKGHAAPETKAAAEHARLLIEQAEKRGEPLKDPLLLFRVLYGFFVVNLVAFDGDVVRELASQFLALAEKQKATVPLMIAHRVVGFSLMATGELAQGRTHFDQSLALYDPANHRSLATLFEADARVSVLCFRCLALWMLGYPKAALADAHHALGEARETGQATALMYALNISAFPLIHCGDYDAASAQLDEAVALTDEKGAAHWNAEAKVLQGCVFALTGEASNAVQMINSGLSAYRLTGTTLRMPEYLSNLARAYADIGYFDDASRCIVEAMTAVEKVKETWYEAEVNRIAGAVALQSSKRDIAKAEAYFQRALAVARLQQAKSWELRASMSLARLWRDQGKAQQARELLAPVYEWFTEGFDTRDLKEAKALLEELAGVTVC